jgi:pimeloyl-ACP methyl ester carboxylesterase
MLRSLAILLVTALAANAAAQAVEVSFETADGIRLFADLQTGAGGPSAPTVMLFHQAGGDARGEYSEIAARLLAKGYNVIAVDQRSGGDRFGTMNRTVERLDGATFGYCEVYPDLEATLGYLRSAGYDGPLAAWGSSYSAALVFQLGAKHAGDVSAVLGFSPASGEPLAGCDPETWLESLAVPALALRPRREYEIDHVRAQLERFAAAGVQTYVAEPGVHGSSMLSDRRSGGSTEATWSVVLGFLDASLRGGEAGPDQREK